MALEVELQEVEQSARYKGAQYKASPALNNTLQRNNNSHGGPSARTGGGFGTFVGFRALAPPDTRLGHYRGMKARRSRGKEGSVGNWVVGEYEEEAKRKMGFCPVRCVGVEAKV